MSMYYKGAVNAEGLLSITDQTAYNSMSEAQFTVDEARHLELMDCRPVLVTIARAYMTRHDVVEAPLP